MRFCDCCGLESDGPSRLPSKLGINRVNKTAALQRRSRMISERREVHAEGEDMFALGSQGRVEERGNGDVEIRGGGKFAVFGGVEGALEVIDFGADVDASGKRFEETVGGDGVGERWEIGEITEGEMNFGYGAIRTEVADAQSESRIELRGVEEMEESALGIDAGNHGVGGDFFATGEYEAGDSTILDANVANFGVGADFGAGLAGRFGEGGREKAESSSRERNESAAVWSCSGR